MKDLSSSSKAPINIIVAANMQQSEMIIATGVIRVSTILKIFFITFDLIVKIFLFRQKEALGFTTREVYILIV